MLNLQYDHKTNKCEIVYNTTDGIKRLTKTYKPLKVVEDHDGIYTNLDNSKHFSIANKDNEKTGDYMYTCLYNDKYNKPDYYLNTILQNLEIVDEVTSPKLLFYDLETNEHASKDKGKGKGRINSIAFIFEGDENVLVKGIDGTEKEILTEFFKYCQDQEVMGLVGYNSFEFDNQVLFNRAKALGVKSDLSQYTNCNLDVMELAHVFQYVPKEQFMSLEGLANKLGLDEAKTDTGYYNPVTLYNNALKDPELMKTFKEYNLQDVRLTVQCFKGMESEQQLNELFKQTLTPYNKVQYNSTLLNCYTCKELIKDKKVINTPVDIPIKFKNSGGFNYYKESDTLQHYNNVCVFDIVSYYPHLLQIIGADPTHPYDNINRDTGEIGKFKEVPDGYLAKLSKDLYESRAKTKQERDKHPKDSEAYKMLDFEQQTKKIIVNSLYGVLSQKGNYYILKNELIGATITALGRDLLDHIIQEYKGVYGKTDSVFIPLSEDMEANDVLNKLNNEINTFFKTKYNLDNLTDDGQLIRFEVDDVLKTLIVKDKNNYIKVSENDDVKLKGGSFNSNKLSDFEKDLNKVIIKKLVVGAKTEDVIKTVEDFTETKLNEDKPLDYYSYLMGLSEKSKDQLKYSGRLYMDEHNINYLYGFKYYACRVVGFTQDYIMYPKGYTVEDYELYKPFAFEQMADRLKNTKVINTSKANELKQKHRVIKAKNNKVDENQTQLFTPTPVKPGNKTIKNVKFNKLNELVPDTLEAYNDGFIKFVPVKPGEKVAKVPKGIQYTYEYIDNNPETFDPTTFNKNDNIGLVRGYGNISVLDVDGLKFLGVEKNQELKKYLLNILKSIDYPFIIQETQSNGYHCLYYTEDTGNFNLGNIHWPVERPDDFPSVIDDKTYKENLSNQSLGSSVIEVFQDLNGYIVFAPSNTKDGEYKLLSDEYTWKQLINKPITHIEDQIDEVFNNKGFYVRDRTVKPGHDIRSTTLNNAITLQVDCTPEAITELTRLTTEILKQAHKHTSKHYTVLYLFGYYSKHITYDNSETIIYDSLKDEELKVMVKDHEHAINTALDNYETPDSNKKTLPGVEEVNDNDSKVIKLLSEIVKVIDGETTEDTETPKSYDDIEAKLEKEHEAKMDPTNYTNYTNTDQVYNYSNTGEGSFLTSQSPIKYRISQNHIKKLRKVEQQLINLFNDSDVKDIKKLINGGYRHYKLDAKVTIKGTVKVYDPNEVFTISDEGLYGFPTIESAIKWNTEDAKSPYTFEVNGAKNPKTKIKHTINTRFGTPKGKQKLSTEQINAIKHLNDLKRVIDEMTILNEVYYVCDGFTQINNELFTTGKNGRSKIGYFAFMEIKRVNLFTPIKRIISPEQSYNFKIKTFKGQILNYENFTIEMIVKELQNKGLLNIGDTPPKNDIRKFIMETDKKQGLETVTLPICPGFFYNKQTKEVITYFPDLKNKYSLKDGVEALNDIFSTIFRNNIKYGTIYWSYFLQALCNIFKDLTLANGCNKQIFLLGEGGAFKTTVLLIAYTSFTTTERFEEQNGGDSVSAILRMASNSTLGQIIDDPKVNINDYDLKNALKRTTNKYEAYNKAGDQFGTNVEKMECYRLQSIAHNDTNLEIDVHGGERRRFNIALFTEADKPTKEQKKALHEYTKADMKVLKLNSIGEAFIKFVKDYFANDKDTYEIRETKGWIIIDDFINYLETETGIKLNSALKNRYEWDDVLEDESLILRRRLRHNYESKLKDKGINVEYNTDTVTEYLNISPMFQKRQMYDRQGNPLPIEWILRKDEFKSFVESKAGLNRHINTDEVLKLLDIPGSYEFKHIKIMSKSSKRVNGMLLKPDEVLEFFYDEYII